MKSKMKKSRWKLDLKIGVSMYKAGRKVAVRVLNEGNLLRLHRILKKTAKGKKIKTCRVWTVEVRVAGRTDYITVIRENDYQRMVRAVELKKEVK